MPHAWLTPHLAHDSFMSKKVALFYKFSPKGNANSQQNENLKLLTENYPSIFSIQDYV
jgi:hypothetical protein